MPGNMATLTIHNVPARVVRGLKALAQRRSTSMEQEIRELLGLWRNKSRSSAAVKKVASRHVDELRTKISELQAMLRTLEHLTANCHGDGRPDCPILDELSSGPAHACHA